MSAAIVDRITEDEARTRRIEILTLVCCDEDAFRGRAETYLPDSRERALFDEFEDLEYLLGH